ncbi:uncharacterized protein Fot_53135 [Forsythia ovata]|uniref:F-box domain-containing protein n=1 Tax=Forsythia ovata TaxID=205694 RepID=A0ABD1PKF1_9LAMI
MSESRNSNKKLKKHGKKEAKSGEIEDGPSKFPSASSLSDGFPDGEVDTEGSAGKRKNGGEEVELQDPLMVFGSEIMVLILGQLDARSVALSRLVSRGWHRIATSDEIWALKLDLINCIEAVWDMLEPGVDLLVQYMCK